MTESLFPFRRGCGVCPVCDKFLYNASGCPCGWKADRSPFVSDPDFVLYVGDVRDILERLPDDSIDCCVTSPPYWGLRDYGTDGQLGLERTPDEYVAAMVAVFAEVRRLLRPQGTLWVNVGDSYASRGGAGAQGVNGAMAARAIANVRLSRRRGGLQGRTKTVDISRGAGNAPGLKPKDLVGIPWRVAFALQADGWYLRSDIVWSKPNPMPESVTDRPTKAHEYVFLLTKSPRYYFDQEAVREQHSENAHHGLIMSRASAMKQASQVGTHGNGAAEIRLNPAGRNVRSVWDIATQPYPDAHFAVFPEALPERCIKAGCPEGGTVLDPFMGSGTTALVARRLGRKSIGIELNKTYAGLAAKRLQQLSLLAEEPAA